MMQEDMVFSIEELYAALTDENKRKFDAYVESLLKNQDCELSKS